MIKISPTWIISLLGNDENTSFTLHIDRQFRAFTENELNLKTGSDLKNIWWGIDHLFPTNNTDCFEKWVINPLAPVCLQNAITEDASGFFINNQISIILYGFVEDIKLTELNKAIQEIRNLNLNLNKIVYCLLFSKKEKFDIKVFKSLNSIEKCDSLLLHGYTNRNSANPDGYATLLDNNKPTDFSKVFMQASQIILNLALGYNELLQNAAGDKLFLAGAFSLVYESEVRKSQLAREFITQKALPEFLNNDKDRLWKDSGSPPPLFDSNLDKLSANEFYKAAVILFNYDQDKLKDFFV